MASSRASSTPLVSVIIPTLDAERHLARCLASLGRQSDGNVEVIVVDQTSHDRTAEIAKRFGARVISLARPKFYSPPARSRNIGARAASGDYLLHLDADMEVPPGVISACVRDCEEKDAVALILHEVDVATGFLASCKALERACYRGNDLVEAARFVRADAFRAIGGYDEAIESGEDWDIQRRYLAYGRVVEGSCAIVHHLGSFTISEQLNKKFAYGRSAHTFLARNDASTIGSAMLRTYWRSRRTLARRPLHLAGLFVLRVGEISAMTLGLLVELATAKARSRTSAR